MKESIGSIEDDETRLYWYSTSYGISIVSGELDIEPCLRDEYPPVYFGILLGGDLVWDECNGLSPWDNLHTMHATQPSL
jgi:hypothetical protein